MALLMNEGSIVWSLLSAAHSDTGILMVIINDGRKCSLVDNCPPEVHDHVVGSIATMEYRGSEVKSYSKTAIQGYAGD
jgi:hypothetical protein